MAASDQIPRKSPKQLTPEMKIEVVKNGPYQVTGGIPLRRLRQVMSPKHEPLAWEEQPPHDPEGETYLLCRCGRSKTMPFCDQTHAKIHFDGAESARTDGSPLREMTFRHDDGFNVTKILPLCMSAGFCVRTDTTFDELAELGETQEERDTVIKMVEDCPAGSLIYRLTPDGEPVEVELGPQIAETIEGVTRGTIRGPIWVMGYIPIERADGVPFIPRNRVTLCTCGKSRNKPLCDGTHRLIQNASMR